MNSLFETKARSSRRVRAMGIALTTLIVGLSMVSYSQQKGTASKILNNSSLLKASDTPSQAKVKVKESVGKLPLAFEPNMGQTAPEVKYVARAKGYTVYLTGNETVLAIQGSKEGVLRMKMENARSASIKAGDKQTSKSNYLRPEGDLTGVPNYGKVTYKGVYPGVDVAYYGNNLNLEYDFVVSPGADASQIHMAYDGTSRFALNKDGDLELETAAGTTLARKPVVYQTIHGVRKPVQAEYVLTADNSVGFKLGAYDRSQALVIDPTLNVLAFLGATAAGTWESDAWSIATQPSGTTLGVYMTGRTASLTFPGGVTTAGNIVAHSVSPPNNYDVFVTALDPTGTTLVYNTFLGTSGDQGGEGIAVDASGNAYVTGYTSFALSGTAPVATSNPSPTGVSPGGVYSAFLAKFSGAGALSALTYLGGPGTTQAYAIAIDRSINSGTGLPTATNGNLVIGGVTNGLLATATLNGEFKTFGGGTTDGFIATYTNALAPVASTYVGGSSYDQVNSVAVDLYCNQGAGGPPTPTFPACVPNIYAAGLTASGNTVTTPPTAFPTGSTVGYDAAGNPNTTYTATNPAVAPLVPVNTVANGGVHQTAFAMKYNNALTVRKYSSIFGPGGETANGIAVDGNGVAYVVGSTWSAFFDPQHPPIGSNSNRSVAGSLPQNASTAQYPMGPYATYGNELASCVTVFFRLQCYPSKTQGFLVALNPPVVNGPFLSYPQTQTIDYVALQAQSAIASTLNGPGPGAPGTLCNLGLPRYSGSIFGVPNNCTTVTTAAGTEIVTGLVQSWNGVTTDTDNQVYIAGQNIPAVGLYGAEVDRYRTGPLQGTAQITTFNGVDATASSQAFAIAVDAFRLAFFDGIVTAPNTTTTLALGPSIPPVTSGIIAHTPALFGAVKAGATTDGLYGALQYLDDILQPTVVNATPITASSPNGGVGVNTPTGNGGPIETVAITNQFGNPVDPASPSCTVYTLGGSFINNFAVGDNIITVGNFTLQQIANTNQIQIELASGATNDSNPLFEQVAISCPGAENDMILTINGTIYGPLNVQANATLLTGLTSGFNTGLIAPYTTTVDGTFTLVSNDSLNLNPGGLYENPLNPGEVVFVPITITTPGSPEAFTATISGQSSNFPSTSCSANGGLLGLSVPGTTVTAGYAGTLTPPVTGVAQTIGTPATFVNGGIIAADVNTACAKTLSPGTYTANIVINNASGGASSTVPFSLTITGGGVVSQNILNLGFLNSSAAPQQTSFSVNAQGSSITYGTNYLTANPPLNPLPSANVQIISGGSGTIANGITNSAIVQVTPTGLNPGVYTGYFQVVSLPLSSPVTVLGTATINVFVGYSDTPSVGVVTGSVGLVNIVPGVSDAVQTPVTIVVPAGTSVGNLTNPNNLLNPNLPTPFQLLQIAAVGDNMSTPLFIGNTINTPGIVAPTITTPSNFPAGATACFLPMPNNSLQPTTLLQPPCELQLTPYTVGQGVACSSSSSSSSSCSPNNGTTCLTYAPSPQLGPQYQQCNYSLNVDTTLLAPGSYSSNVTFTATNGDVLVVPINLEVTATPTLLLTQTIQPGSPDAGLTVPVTALTFSGTAGTNAIMCQNVQVYDTGGTVTGAAVSSTSPWITFGPLGSTAPPINGSYALNFGLPSSLTLTAGTGVTPGEITNGSAATFEVCVNPVFAGSTVAGIATGTINFVSSGGPQSLTVTLNLGGTGTGTGTGTGAGNPANLQQIATFRSLVSGAAPGAALGEFMEDLNETTYNYSAATTLTNFFGLSGDKPVAGDFYGTGTVEIGVFRCPAAGAGVCSWYIDKNNNGTWDGVAGGDDIWSFGLPGDIPVVGDWTGNGISKIGVFRCPTPGVGVCTWILDAGNNHTFNAGTAVTYFYGLTGDQPVVSNWNQTGTVDQIGVMRCPAAGVCTWYVDAAGTGASVTNYQYGVTGDIPIVGNWQGTGHKRIGVFRGGSVVGGPATVILNLPGNNVFTTGLDLVGSFGLQGDLPVVGFWTN